MSASYASHGNLLSTLPRKTWATENLRHGIRLVPREQAMNLPYLALNSDFSTAWITFDVDRQGAAFAWEDAGLPMPTFAVINPENAHAHLVYRVNYVWHRDEDELHTKAFNLLRLIKLSFTSLLEADPMYVGKITKNPLHPRWKTISGPEYTLSELADYIPQGMSRTGAEAAHRQARAKQVTDLNGRNCALFDLMRFEAYSRVRDFTARAEFGDWVLRRCKALNSGGLPCSEVRATARSVAKYVWANKDRPLGRKKCTPDQIRQRQQLAAERTNLRRRSCTVARIKQARAYLIQVGHKDTQAAIARALGVSIRTVQRLQHDMTSAPPSQITTCQPEPSQVSAPLAVGLTKDSRAIGFLKLPHLQRGARGGKRVQRFPRWARLAGPLVPRRTRPCVKQAGPSPPVKIIVIFYSHKKFDFIFICGYN